MARTFASIEDIKIRTGRPLTDAETSQAQLYLELAAGLICQAVGKGEAWANELDPIPPVLRVVSIEVAARVMSNPELATRFDETLGAYRKMGIYKVTGLELSEGEERLVRFAVYGTNTGYSTPDSLADDFGAAYPYGNRYFPSESSGVANILESAVDR